jgi:hypothetical protein
LLIWKIRAEEKTYRVKIFFKYEYDNLPPKKNYERGIDFATRGLAVAAFGLAAGLITTISGSYQTIAKFTGLSIGLAETLNVVVPMVPGFAMMIYGAIVSNRKG